MKSARLKLESLCEVFNGKTPSKEEQRDSGYPILKIKDIGDDGKVRGEFESFVDNDFYTKYAEKKLKENDVLILNAAHSSEYVGSKMTFARKELDGIIPTGEWLIIRASDDRILPEYPYCYFSSPEARYAIRNLVKGIHLYPKDVRQISIPLPDLETQQQIVFQVKKMQSLFEKRRQSIAKLDQLTQALFMDMFGDPITNSKGWRVEKLSDVANVKIGPFGSLLHKSDYITGGIPLVNPTHLINNKIVADFDLTLTEEKHRELSPYHLQTGDVVLGRRGEMGRCGLVTLKENGYLCGTGSMFIRPTEKINSIFLLHLLSSEQIRKDLDSKALGVTMKNLNAGTVSDLSIICPDISIQEHYAKTLQKIESLIMKNQKSLGGIENLQQSLMDSFFGA